METVKNSTVITVFLISLVLTATMIACMERPDMAVYFMGAGIAASGLICAVRELCSAHITLKRVEAWQTIRRSPRWKSLKAAGGDATVPDNIAELLSRVDPAEVAALDGEVGKKIQQGGGKDGE